MVVVSSLLGDFLGIAIATLLVFLGFSSTLGNFRVAGPSMERTLADGQRVAVNKLAYARLDLHHLAQLIPFWEVEEPKMVPILHPPRRGDLVVFRSPMHPDVRLVKRVVGLPGEVVELRNGRVYVDDITLDEPYAATSSREETRSFPRLKEDEYFVMGDNRSQSHDSRFWGPVPLKNMIGKVWFIYWPFSEFGLPSVRADGPRVSVAPQLPPGVPFR